MNYLFVALGGVVMWGALYFSAFRSPSAINLSEPNRCDRRGLHNVDLTYQGSCPNNRSVYRTYYGRRGYWGDSYNDGRGSTSTRRGFSGAGGPSRRRGTVRGFRGGGPGAGK